VTPSLSLIGENLRKELDTFQAPVHPKGTIGGPLDSEWIVQAIEELKGSLVAPYMSSVSVNEYEQADSSPRDVVIVADFGAGWLLAYDPDPDGDYDMVRQVNGRMFLYQLRGDAVGSYLSR
jgi:hypothetical protein